uniref:Uncharacterized protein n=1 Tax=Romanomermis culicivorax TaxID=13658 RepID=A0A915JRP6_ROMCU
MQISKALVSLLFIFCYSVYARAPNAPRKSEPTAGAMVDCSPGSDVKFSWNEVPGATSYMIEISACDGATNCENPDDNPSAFAPINHLYPEQIKDNTYAKPLEHNQEYWWRVWAKRGSVNGRRSGWSNFHCN